MSPKNKIKLNLLRKKLDNIDYQLLKVIKKRTVIVKKVLSLKGYKKEIIDKKRISVVLKKSKIICCVEVIFFQQISHVF